MSIDNRLGIRNRRSATFLILAVSEDEEKRYTEAKKKDSDADANDDTNGEFGLIAVLEELGRDGRELVGRNFADKGGLK